MHASRRDFLRFSLAGSSMVALTGAIPNFLGRTAAQAPQAQAAGARDTILVVVQLTGGNDGLNTVIPFKDETYKKLRPTLALPESGLKKLNDTVGLHCEQLEIRTVGAHQGTNAFHCSRDVFSIHSVFL